MDFTNIPLFNVLKSKLNYHSERQGLLAQNVANADTPGYKAKDIQSPDFKKMVSNAGHSSAQKLHMTTTSAKHMGQTSATATEFKIIKRPNTDEQNPDGNNVVVEEEMSKVAQNQAEYQKALSLYGKTISMFKVAIGNPNGG